MNQDDPVLMNSDYHSSSVCWSPSNTSFFLFCSVLLTFSRIHLDFLAGSDWSLHLSLRFPLAACRFNRLSASLPAVSVRPSERSGQ